MSSIQVALVGQRDVDEISFDLSTTFVDDFTNFLTYLAILSADLAHFV